MQVKAHEGSWGLTSPNGRIEVQVRLQEGIATYAVRMETAQMLAWSPLGILTSVADFRDHLVCLGEIRAEIDESYTMVAGKTDHAVAHCRELRLRLGRHRYAMDFVIRAYDDGVAYRYEMGGVGPIQVYAEKSGFVLAEPSPWKSWAQTVTANYEAFYPRREGHLRGAYNFPLLLEQSGARWMLLSEAGVYGQYCGSHVMSDEDAPGLLRLVFAVDQVNPVQAIQPMATPWRVAILTETLADLFSSTLIETLNPGPDIVDTSWIRPGRVYWSWWAGEPQDRVEVQKAYVDFAANMGWEFFLCDAGWKMEWIEELLDYAHARQVDILVWAHHRDLLSDEDREETLALWARLGISGIKVDFFDSDCQDTIRIYDALAQATARHRLLLNYHGATKPSGERRRWPHLLTREGVYGAEQYRGIHDAPTAVHNCTLPFTRNVVGPMDYTPVTFSKVRGQTTRAHQLALPVIFESSLQHLSESIPRFRDYGEEAMEFLKACPSSWEQSQLIEGYPGEWVVIARQRGGDWWIGAISADPKPKRVSLALSFLEEGLYQAHRYQDDDTGTLIRADHGMATPRTTLDVVLAPCGGAAVWLQRQFTAPV